MKRCGVSTSKGILFLQTFRTVNRKCLTDLMKQLCLSSIPVRPTIKESKFDQPYHLEINIL